LLSRGAVATPLMQFGNYQTEFQTINPETLDATLPPR